MRRPSVPAFLSFLTAVLWFSVACAADWPQYRGADQGLSREKVKLQWPASGPKTLWKIPTQNGFSSFAICGGKAFTQVNRDVNSAPREVCVAIDAASGKELWFADIGEGKYKAGGNSGAKGNNGGDGPRGTPTISAGRVYCYTQDLVLYCLDAATGKLVWKKDVMQDHAGRNINWNSAMSALVDGALVFVGGGGPGESLLAIDKTSGQVVWKAHDEMITHAMPVAATIQGVRQVIFYLQKGLVAVAPHDGKILWRFAMPYKVSSAASPVVAGDIVFCSAGYGVGGAACKISKQGDACSVAELWRIPDNKEVANHWSTPVYKDGYLYGMFSFKKFGVGPLKCVELATGKVKWEQPGFGQGNVILAGDQLAALADDGRLVIVEATPTAYKELAQTHPITGKCWSTPAVSDGRLYVRSTKEGACLDVSGK